MPDGGPWPFFVDERLPPSNPQAEQALLGALLANNKAYDLVAQFLRPEHFADQIHGRIYQAIQQRVDAGKLADAVMLKSEFERAGILEEVGGTEYLTQLLTAMVGIINAGDYGRAIYAAWARRQLINIGETVVNACFSGDQDFSKIASDAAFAIDHISAGNTVRGGISLARAAAESLQRGKVAADRHARRTAGEIIPSVTTGLSHLDERFGEMEGGCVYVLTAEPGGGKTALAIQIMVHNVMQKVPVLYVSTEMRGYQIGRRALSHLTSVPTKTIKSGQWSEAEQLKLGDSAAALEKYDRYGQIEDSPGLDTRIIGSLARAFVRKHRADPHAQIGLIVIDHMHDLSEMTEHDLLRAVGMICHGVKGIAQQNDWPVLLLAQMNRGASRRENRRPEMTDLYGGRKIEAIAEGIVMMHRPETFLDPFPPERKSGEMSDKFTERYHEWRKQWDKWRGIVQGFVPKCREGDCGVELWHFNGASNSLIETTMSENGEF